MKTKLSIKDLEALIEAKVQERLEQQKEDDTIEIEEETIEEEENISSENDNQELLDKIKELEEKNKEWEALFNKKDEEFLSKKTTTVQPAKGWGTK